MKKTGKFRQSVAAMLAVLMVITMLPQNSMLTFAAETAAMENPGTISENDGKSGEDAAAGEEKAEGTLVDGGEADEELDKEEASGEGAAEDDGSEEGEPENPEGISENTIEEPVEPEGISDNTIDGTALLFGMENGTKSTSSEGDFVIKDGVLTGYNGTATDLVIPDTVKTIGKNFLMNNQTITSVTFSASVTTIGAGAFQNCKALAKVELQEGLVTIGEGAFAEAAFGGKLSTGLIEGSSLKIPSTVREIGAGAFRNCAYLEGVEFADGDTAVLTIGQGAWYAFADCGSLKRVVLPKRLKVLPKGAFSRCAKLEEVTLQEGLEVIGDSAFAECGSLKGIVFPTTLKTVGGSAFSKCKALGKVELKEGLVTIGDDAFAEAGFGTQQDTGAVENEKLRIPSTVQEIGAGAFRNCAYLEEVEFADGDTAVLTIRQGAWYAFADCGSLKRVVLPKRLKVLPKGAFIRCAKLEEVTLQEGLEVIGDSVFSGCKSLRKVELKEGLVTIGDDAFAEAAFGGKLSTGLIEGSSLKIPSTVQEIGVGAFRNCAYLEEVEFADGDTAVLTIGQGAWYAFADCGSLKRVVLPKRLKILPKGAFSRCAKLEEVTLQEGLEVIGDSAFAECGSLKGIVFPTTLKTVGGSAFSKCKALGKVELKEGLVTIGDDAFAEAGFGTQQDTGAVENEKLRIPSTVQEIGAGAFRNCAYLEEVEFADGDTAVLTIGQGAWYAFAECGSLKRVVLPKRLKVLPKGAFSRCAKLEEVTMQEGLEVIGDSAFSGCKSLRKVELKEGLVTIGDDAFAEAAFGRKLGTEQIEGTSLRIPSTVREIGRGAFRNCAYLEAVEFANGDTAVLTMVNRTDFNSFTDCASLKRVVLPERLTILPRGPFTNCPSLNVIYIPASVKTINDGALGNCPKAVIYGEPGSEAENYARKNGIAFKDKSLLPEKPEEKPEEDPKEDPEGGNEAPEINMVRFPGNKDEYSAVYTGGQIRPVMAVSYQYTNGSGQKVVQKLKLNQDYTVRYSNNVNTGDNTAQVTVRGIGEYTGSITKKYSIRQKSIKNVSLSPVGDIVFGEKPSVCVTDGTKELEEGIDYTVELSEPGRQDVDTVSELRVKGIGNYEGVSSKKVKFNILRKDTNILPIRNSNISVEFKKLPENGYTYNGKAMKPGVVVKDKTTGKKVPASMYKVVYTNNVNAGKGTAKAWVVGVSKNGKGYYGISEPLPFDIRQKDFSKVSASLSGTIPKVGSMEDIKNAVGEAITVKEGKRVLSDETAYTVDYSGLPGLGEIEIGKIYKIKLLPKTGGNYLDGSSKTVKVKFGQLNLASKTAKVSVRIVDAERSEIVLKYNGITLVKEKDYKVSMKKKDGKYTVTVTAVKGSAYKGKRTVKNLTV